MYQGHTSLESSENASEGVTTRGQLLGDRSPIPPIDGRDVPHFEQKAIKF